MNIKVESQLQELNAMMQKDNVLLSELASLQLELPISLLRSLPYQRKIVSAKSLYHYPVEEIQFIGQIWVKEKKGAVLRLPDDSVYTVFSGDSIGRTLAVVDIIYKEYVEVSQQHIEARGRKGKIRLELQQ